MLRVPINTIFYVKLWIRWMLFFLLFFKFHISKHLKQFKNIFQHFYGISFFTSTKNGNFLFARFIVKQKERMKKIYKIFVVDIERALHSTRMHQRLEGTSLLYLDTSQEQNIGLISQVKLDCTLKCIIRLMKVVFAWAPFFQICAVSKLCINCLQESQVHKSCKSIR